MCVVYRYSTPFVHIASAYMYPDLHRAKEAVSVAGDMIKKNGLPADVAPMTFVFTGNGNVSKGAQEIFKLLPHKMVKPSDLPHLPTNQRNLVYGCAVDEHSMVRYIHTQIHHGSFFY
jgi:alpha-aminoadipic semialdehyde synthase